MTSLRTKRHSYVRTATAWDMSQAWRARRRDMAKRFLNDSSLAANAFATARSNQISGTASLAATAALERIQSTTAARLDKSA